MNKLDLSNTADRTFPIILRKQAEQNGDATFLLTDEARVSFAQADAITDCLAAGLKGLGVGKGDIVSLFLGNRPEIVLLALAVNKLGALWTPINGDYKGQWLLDNLQMARSKVLITDDQFQDRIASIESQLDIEKIVLVGDMKDSQLSSPVDYQQLLDHPPVELDYSQLHYGDSSAILWTSGTTGKSKGVLQSYNCWIRAIVEGCSLQYNSQPGDSIFCVLPLYHTAAWITSVYRALIEGIPCIIEPRFSVTTFWERIEHFGATQTFLLGAMGAFLLNAPERENDADTPLRLVQIVPLAPNQWPIFEKRFGVQLIRTGLGQSECMLVTTQLENRDDVPVYALGFPVNDTAIHLLDDDGNEVATGEVGEICIKPLKPHVIFNGYFDNPEATADAYFGDYYRTGDLARQDPATGVYFYADRKKDALRFAGRNISTLEVEGIVRTHPAVADVAAFGIPSKEVESEQELKLNIILKEGKTCGAEELCGFINDKAPHYFVPRYLDFVDQLPYTPTNKVQKFKLREEGVGEKTWDLKNSDYVVRK
ncbi:MAG: AMP-binding protein [Gammaproteobacteria bacterium]|nr:AMP-binding protein [Gammaproteobacteria bacterium]MBT8151453.1 AMP-binding protein [Gammaproteobacteria bacterium]NNM11883.1 AMP-binding protein [Pseudomonadales bacterium]RZV57778.1 MAG: AMP-binding protein [Pseudomonadales bacterium]